MEKRLFILPGIGAFFLGAVMFTVLLRPFGATPEVLHQLTPVVILKGGTLNPDDLLSAPDGEHTVAFREPVNTHFPGKQTAVLDVSRKKKTVYSAEIKIYILEPSRIVEKEAGTAPGAVRALDFFTNNEILGSEADYDLRFVTDVNSLNMDVVTWHDVTLMFGNEEITATLKIVDTISPFFTPVDVVINPGETVEAGDFVRDIIDASPVTVFFPEGYAPEIFKSGSQTVTFVLEDTYGNQSIGEAMLTVRHNTTPPVLSGVQDLHALLGGSVMYRQGVTAEDSFGNPVGFTIENNVDLNTPGEYTATYIATDSDGNETRQTVSVTVLEIQEEMLNDMIQAILDRIIKDNMTQREMAQAIYNWIRNNVHYVSDAPKDSVYDGAYRALKYRSGDCFTFYAISEILLSKVGIPNMRLERIEGTRTRHYWNIVNADDAGWYHFDTTPTAVQNINRFMFTESKAQEYTQIMLTQTRTRDYYTYDRESCPVEVMP